MISQADQAKNHKPVRMIAIDIDGTLLPSKGTAISQRNRQALLQAKAAGIEVVIATGRRHAYAMPLLSPLGLTPETVLITSNGTVTRTLEGTHMDRHFLPLQVARELCGDLRQFGGTAVFTFDKLGKGELVIESLTRLNERIDPWIQANIAFIEEIDPIERAFDAGEPPVQGMVCGTVPEMYRAKQWLATSRHAGAIELNQTAYPVRDLSILDILPPGCSKGVALGKLAAERGIAREEVMAIGDNFNDVEMLKYAGQPVLMANAVPELLSMGRSRGWQVALSNDDDGVAATIEAVLDRTFDRAMAELR
ncbi:Cof-type HAD-IIB family hydrolase [Acidipila rosea]|uniref:Cof subfamily protein (Haloacid dehalogenase superfamily)/HAD superfamily hydrolase (TIGR01484 family) n=1 Tax=Acidipila rosea TaxID=768535 RepID=A0A4R1LC11_9BACT|nr:Cof-type HAD-IIB family hydrolase [Acidipila rosea]TCK75107.1 hypothetical protein C7378_0087 [Acidipila rosea]